MENKTIDEMSEEEFETLLDRIEEGAFEQLTPSAFGEALWALEEEQGARVIELTACVVDDELRFYDNGILPVQGNEILFGNTRVVVKLHGLTPPALHAAGTDC